LIFELDPQIVKRSPRTYSHRCLNPFRPLS